MSRVTCRISMPDLNRHLYTVEMHVVEPEAETVFRMPVWTPGSYLVREYARHVENVTAWGDEGVAIPVRKRDKAAWEVESKGHGSVTLAYQVYAYDLTVRTSHLDATHGYFNGANVFAFPEGYEASPIGLEVTPPEGWSVSVALPRQPLTDDGVHRFWAVDFDELVDSPVECGPHEEVLFNAGGITHRWVSWGEPGFDIAPLLGDVTAIIDEEIALFGELPADVDDYLFIAHVQDRRNGGLEHKKSQTIGIDRRTLHHAKSYEDFVTLVAHEYFHLWNVKRIRPQGLGPFDYSQENYTPLLWMMEGFTGYYDTLIPVRAGLISVPRYLEILGERIAALRSTPGRHVRSLEQSSFDAWIKLYRPDANTKNTAVSYYLKGELVALLLDLTIRLRSQGASSLDDVMRFLWVRQRDTGAAIDPADVNHIFQEATGCDLTAELDAWVRDVSDLPFASRLADAGLAFEGRWKKTYDRTRLEGGAKKEAGPWLGLTTVTAKGRAQVSTIRSDSPAADASVYVGDELIAIDDIRVDSESWKGALSLRQPGDVVTLTLARRKRLVRTEVTLAQAPHDAVEVKIATSLSDTQRGLLETWFGQSLSEDKAS